jgi:hypothetical protein
MDYKNIIYIRQKDMDYKNVIYMAVADSGPGFRVEPPSSAQRLSTSWAGIYFCQFQTILAVVYSLIKTFIILGT